MLKKITWPLPFKIEGNANPISAQTILLEIVMSRDYWRSSFEMINAGDTICDELIKDEPFVLLTAGLHEKLIGGSKLENQGIQPPSVNRFYFKILKAIHTATDVEE